MKVNFLLSQGPAFTARKPEPGQYKNNNKYYLGGLQEWMKTRTNNPNEIIPDRVVAEALPTELNVNGLYDYKYQAKFKPFELVKIGKEGKPHPTFNSLNPVTSIVKLAKAISGKMIQIHHLEIEVPDLLKLGKEAAEKLAGKVKK